MVWAVNFSVVKMALGHLTPFAFNTLRLVGASIVFLILARVAPGPPLQREDRGRFLILALVGHLGYQLLFIQGLDQSTAGHSAILLAMTPVFVAILSTILGVEPPSARGWLGIVISIAGVYLVLYESQATGRGARGDWLTLGASLCWSIYTVFGQPAIARYGLFKTNAYTMVLGTLFFLPLGLPALAAVSPSDVPPSAWGATVFSFVFALVLAYSLWYYAVSRIGPSQTAVYSNLMPVIALIVAWLWLGETLGWLQVVGTGTILFGIYLVRHS